jgi:hypothetical protein
MELNLDGLPNDAIHVSGFSGEDLHGATSQKTAFFKSE